LSAANLQTERIFQIVAKKKADFDEKKFKSLIIRGLNLFFAEKKQKKSQKEHFFVSSL